MTECTQSSFPLASHFPGSASPAATDDPMHGKQKGRFFQGCYGGYCYLQGQNPRGLAGTGMAKAQCQTIRLRLLKIGAPV